MSISGLFNIASSALSASQSALSAVNTNIANVNTPGYTRQDVILTIANVAASAVGDIGGGVAVAGTRRSYDQYLETQLLGQQQSQSKSETMDQILGQVEQVFNEAQNVGLSSAMNDFFNSWQDVASDPSSLAARQVVLQKGTGLVSTAKNMERNLTDIVSGINSSLTDVTSQINSLAKDIASLNDQIVRAAGGTSDTAGTLRDQRQQKLTSLAKLTDFSSYEDQYGSITVAVGMRNLVSGTQINTLSSVPDSSGSQQLYLDGINVTTTISEGQIGALVAARTHLQSDVLPGFRRLVASLTQQVNLQHQAGYGLDSSTGNDFFNQLQLATTESSAGASVTSATIANLAQVTLSEYKIAFTPAGAGTYTYNVYDTTSGSSVVQTGTYSSGSTISFAGIDVIISGLVTSTDSFTVSPITNAVSGFGVALTNTNKIAAASATTELPDGNTNASSIAQSINSTHAELGSSTYSTYYNSLVATVGSMKQSSAASLSFDNNLLSSLQTQRESISGVSLDEEAANLIRFQRAYEAGAKMISVTDQLLQTVIGMAG